MEAKVSLVKGVKIAQLVAAGAVIGFYTAKAFGFFVGVELTHLPETLGAVTGAIIVAAGKILHIV